MLQKTTHGYNVLTPLAKLPWLSPSAPDAAPSPPLLRAPADGGPPYRTHLCACGETTGLCMSVVAECSKSIRSPARLSPGRALLPDQIALAGGHLTQLRMRRSNGSDYFLTQASTRERLPANTYSICFMLGNGLGFARRVSGSMLGQNPAQPNKTRPKPKQRYMTLPLF
jgi:hypothetical protein